MWKHTTIMKVYRAEICGSTDSCTEFWEYFPITELHTSKKMVERKIAHLKNLEGKDLEKAISKMGVNAYFGTNKPVIEEYEVIETKTYEVTLFIIGLPFSQSRTRVVEIEAETQGEAQQLAHDWYIADGWGVYDSREVEDE